VSNVALTWAFSLPITGARKAVLVALADHVDEKQECYPSMSRLQLFSGLKERAIQAAIGDLRRAGLISVEAGGGRSRTNLYRLAVGETPQDMRGNGTDSEAETPQQTPKTPQDMRGNGRAETPQILHETPHLVHETPQDMRQTPQQMHPNPKEPSENPQRTLNGASPPAADLFGGNPGSSPGPDAEPPSKRARPTRRKPQCPIPDGWKPDETGIAYARDRGVLRNELSKFVNYHTSKGTLMSNWQAGWRTWCDNAVTFGTATGRPKDAPLDRPLTQAEVRDRMAGAV
jgi:hypothetical protein